MAQVTLRADIKTVGGEVCDIMLDDQFVGTMTLVYRESDRMSGSIQLDEESLSEDEKELVIAFLEDHIGAMVDALDLDECDVVVSYSEFEQVISEENPMYTEEFFEDDIDDEELSFNEIDEDYHWDDEGIRYNTGVIRNHVDEMDFDDDLNDVYVEYVDDDEDSTEYYASSEIDGIEYELVAVNESRNKIDYHVYDQDQDFIAEIFATIHGRDLFVNVNWMFEPAEEEIDLVAELIMQDFDEDAIDTAVLNMSHDGEIFETIDLTHEDLLMDADEDDEDYLIASDDDTDFEFHDEDYSVILTRDDGDTLTYEIYQDSHGGLPIGTATIDISERLLTGFIDFREPGSSDDREFIVAMLMQELDKEKDYSGLNLTMLYNNDIIEEMQVEAEQIH